MSHQIYAPHIITMRSRSDQRIVGYYDGTDAQWTTDFKRALRFERVEPAMVIIQGLRERCPPAAYLIGVTMDRTFADPLAVWVAREEAAWLAEREHSARWPMWRLPLRWTLLVVLLFSLALWAALWGIVAYPLASLLP